MEDNIKMSILPKMIDVQRQAILTKIPVGYLVEIDKLILTSTWKSNGPREDKLF